MNNVDPNLAHILLVEDNEGDILLTLEAFEECKLKTKISVARNGKEALEFLFKRGTYTNIEKPDLVLLDINIPIYNGHKVLKQIKADPVLKKIPVIMLTTSCNKQDIDSAYENHCNSYVKKPLDIAQFLSTIVRIEDFYLQLSTLSR